MMKKNYLLLTVFVILICTISTSYAQSINQLTQTLTKNGLDPSNLTNLKTTNFKQNKLEQPTVTDDKNFPNEKTKETEKKITLNDLSRIEKMFYLFENEETQLTHELELIKENVERANSTEKNFNFTNNKTKNSLSVNTISTEKETINKDNKEKERKSEFKEEKVIYQYGYKVFKNSKPLNTNETYKPVNDDYILGPNDTLIIRLWGKIEETFNETIDKNGNIYLPKIGYITLSGEKFKNAKNIIKKEFQKYYVNFDMSITMGQLKTIKVFVVGEANNPGSYDISSMSTLFNALHAAEGVTKDGSLRKIELRRNNKTYKTIDLYDYLISGDYKQDPTLESNDTIFIPPIGDVVKIYGSIKRPSIYELKNKTSIKELIFKLGSGYSADAIKNKIKIERIENGKRIIKDFNNLRDTDTKNYLVRNGDSIFIPKVLNIQQNIVKVIGNVYRPGTYEVNDKLSLKDLIKKADGIKPNSITEKIEIIRYNDDKTRSIKFVNYEVNPSFELKNWDIINIISEEDFYGQQTVEILGAVNYPGKYPLLKELTVSNLIDLAKPKTNSILNFVELYRNDGDIEFIKTFNLIENKTINFKLIENDVVTVRYKQKVRPPKKITIKGEVNYPGVYIALENEKLSTLLKRAGGFTNNAFMAGIILKRTSVKTQEANGYTKVLNEEKKRLIFDQSKLKLIQEMDSFNASLLFLEEKIYDAEGRVVININSINDLENSNHDINLENGDEIIIPKIPKSIQVVGGVQQPTALIYTKGKSPKHYVNLAGNYTNYANKNKIYVFRANGSIKLNPSLIQPGDTIYIPENIKFKISWAQILQSTVDLLFKTASTVALINNLN